MPTQNQISKNQTSISASETEKIVFTQKPSGMSNDDFAKSNGFIYARSNKKKVSKYNQLSEETIKIRNDYLKKRFDCETWKNSKMRDRMHRLKIYGIMQQTYINREGEESNRILYPAFNSHEMEESLNKKRQRFEETGDPASLHDWSCSISNGCSEEELRETIMDLRIAEQNYPEQKKRRPRVYYTTDNEGFTKRVVNRRNKKKPRNQESTYPPPGSIKFNSTWIVPVDPNTVDTIGDS